MYYRCPKCGSVYYSAATLKDEQLDCDKCGAKVELFDNGCEGSKKKENSKMELKESLEAE
ncbi:hypothetical protein ACSFC1_10070 [Pseudothermotoga sp. U03pept]|uniref:hypothetical protein n=1 Tax=Pseudothermotoga sp. U03pept TaxID=3447012 RepID=UPI003F01A5E2